MKRRIKEFLLFLGALLRRDASPKVVFYHDVGRFHTPMGTESALFWAHMRGLREGDLVCFDDGFQGVWDAREQFRQMEIFPKVFIAPRLVGKAGYLNWDQIRVLQNEFGFNFQSHTWSHQTLAGPMIVESPVEERSEAWFERELVASRVEISRELGTAVDELCLPVGYYTDSVLKRCQDAGYRRVFTSCPGNRGGGFLQPRCLVQDLSLFAFRAVLNGGFSLLNKRYVAMYVLPDAMA